SPAPPRRGFPARRRTRTWRYPGRSGEPALAALVVLGVAERFALALGDAEVELLDVLVLAQRLGVAVHDDAAVLEDVAVARVFERHVGVLLGEQERDAFLLVEAVHDLENFLDDLRGEPHRRLVEQDHLRA